MTGRLDKVDEKMNITMSNVVYRDIDDTETKFSLFYIQGKNVRFIHIPDDIDMLEAIRSHVTGIHGINKNVRSHQERRKRGNKQKKRLQRETLERKQQELLQKLGMATKPP